VSVALFILGGLLAGGTVSLVKQGATKFSVVLTGALALLAIAAGILWMFPREGA
jgi:hypothetical protein